MIRAVQGATYRPRRITWTDDAGAPVDLTNKTISAKMSVDGATWRTVTGSLLPVSPFTTGLFDWDFSTADLSTAGVWAVQFSAIDNATSEVERTYLAMLTIEKAR